MGTEPCPFIKVLSLAVVRLQHLNWVVITKTLRSMRWNIWPFKNKFANPYASHPGFFPVNTRWLTACWDLACLNNCIHVTYPPTSPPVHTHMYSDCIHNLCCFSNLKISSWFFFINIYKRFWFFSYILEYSILIYGAAIYLTSALLMDILLFCLLLLDYNIVFIHASNTKMNSLSVPILNFVSVLCRPWHFAHGVHCLLLGGSRTVRGGVAG